MISHTHLAWVCTMLRAQTTFMSGLHDSQTHRLVGASIRAHSASLSTSSTMLPTLSNISNGAPSYMYAALVTTL